MRSLLSSRVVWTVVLVLIGALAGGLVTFVSLSSSARVVEAKVVGPSLPSLLDDQSFDGLVFDGQKHVLGENTCLVHGNQPPLSSVSAGWVLWSSTVWTAICTGDADGDNGGILPIQKVVIPVAVLCPEYLGGESDYQLGCMVLNNIGP